MRPFLSAAILTARAASSREETSAAAKMAEPPLRLISEVVIWPASTSISTTRTVAPSSANNSLMALPMPCAPPVTMAIFDLSRDMASQVGQKLALSPDFGARDGRAPEIGHVEFVEV